MDQYSNQTKSLDQALSETVKAAAEAARKANLRLDDAESNILAVLEYEPRLVLLESSRKAESPVVAAAIAPRNDGPFSIGARSAGKPFSIRHH